MPTRPHPRGRWGWTAAAVACVFVAAGCSSAGARGARSTPALSHGAAVAPDSSATVMTPTSTPPQGGAPAGAVNAPAAVPPTAPPTVAPAPPVRPAAGPPSAPPAVAPPAPTSAPTTAAAPPACRADGTGCAPNQPMTVRATASPAHPAAGDTVTFSVTAADPDAPIDPGGCGRHHVFGDERSGTTCAPSCAAPDPSATFQPTPGRIDETFTHVYAAPGTYTAVFDYHSGGECSGDPYASSGEARVIVIVS